MAQSTQQPQTQQPSLTQIPVLNSQSKYALVVRGTTIYIRRRESRNIKRRTKVWRQRFSCVGTLLLEQ